MRDKNSGFFYDDGGEINLDLTAKPILCVSCKKDDDPSQEILCTLNRVGQVNEKEFRCDVTGVTV